jgi:hypothetical protein
MIAADDDSPVMIREAQHEPAPGDPRARAGARPAFYKVVCTDQGEVRVVADGAAATLTSRTYVNDLAIAEAFGDVVPPECADLVDMAIAVYVSDRLCRRHPRGATRSEPLWQRQMSVEVPVREPERWRHEGLGEALSELLRYLTDDVWEFTFVPRRAAAARPSESQRGLFLEPPPPPASAALFSGGLDSLAGLVARLSGNSRETVVLFCGRTNKRIGAPQRALLEALTEAFPQRVRPVAVGFGLNGRRRGAFDHEETSQRTRGFVFQAFGAVTARMAGLRGLDVYENGVGAINLPYTDAQLGSQATRATHPVTLRLMSALLSRVFGAPFTVALPYAFKTKGELCNALRDAGLARLATRSVSCDGYPQRSRRADQCGVCPSCLLRRQSLHHAGLLADDPSSLYMHDVFDASASDAYERRFSLRAMGGQVHHLRRALASPRPWERMAARYPELEEAADAMAGPDGGVAVRESLVALYRRYCEEWGAFAEAAARPRNGAPDGAPASGVEVTRVASGGRIIAPSAAPVGARLRQRTLDLWSSAELGGAHEW